MANLHSFTGNEVIATDVPKYLNQNFSALNEEATALSNTVVKTVNNTSPVNGNVNIVGFDSYWSANEQVSLGDIRIPKGRENSGLFFECVKAGTTGSSQPEVDTSILADFSDVGRIGQVRWIYNIAEKDDDEIFATGVAYSRATYSALWSYVQSKPALLITEAEWQAKYTATGGKFVPYYSSGDGSSTFRTPLLCAYATGVADNSKIGTFKEAGLPNITGTIAANYNANQRLSGAFDNPSGYTGVNGLGYGSGCEGQLNFDASKSNPIYGKSDTVTPDTMYGVWVIKAFGLIVNAENTDVSNLVSGVNRVENILGNVQNDLNTLSSSDYFPDYSSYVQLSAGDFTPTVSGWLVMHFRVSADYQEAYVQHKTTGVYLLWHHQNRYPGNGITIGCPVVAGEVYTIVLGGSSESCCRFYALRRVNL